MTRDERAVSEVVGFVLSFSIIVLAVSVTYAGGFGAVLDTQSAERTDNAERAMVALSENFDDVERGAGPVRAGEIRLDEGSLSVDRASSFSLTVAYNGNSTKTFDVTPGSIAYAVGDTTIRYETGAVLRSDGGDARLQRSPRMSCSDDYATVSVVEIRTPESVSETSAAGSVLVAVEGVGTELYYPMRENGSLVASADAADNVTVSIDRSPDREGWERWFDDHDGWTATADGYECDADAVYVRVTRVEVELIR